MLRGNPLAEFLAVTPELSNIKAIWVHHTAAHFSA